MIGEDVAEREATGEGGDGGRERQRQTKRVNRSDKDSERPEGELRV